MGDKLIHALTAVILAVAIGLSGSGRVLAGPVTAKSSASIGQSSTAGKVDEMNDPVCRGFLSEGAVIPVRLMSRVLYWTCSVMRSVVPSCASGRECSSGRSSLPRGADKSPW